MSDHVFKSKYSLEEMEKNFKDLDFFNGIKEGLEEALAYEKGKASAETIARKRSLPDVNVKAERESLDMTQKAFANVLGVSRRTVEAWETGRTSPRRSPTASERTADDCVLNADGKIDYHVFKPVLFEFPTYEYFVTGDAVGRCGRMNG